MTDILQIEHLTKSFGELYAVNDLSFEVRKGEILGIMGPNGAGKTTVFNLITGVLSPDQGSITFQDKDITKMTPANRCRQGIGRTYQIPRPFDNMTVLENLLIGSVHGGGFSEKRGKKVCFEILDMIGLYAAKDRMAGGLPLLDRKRLELGRALATRPTLILLDEIAGGLTEKEAEQVLQVVKKIWEQGITIVWIEHILMMMSEGTDRLLVIAEGGYLRCGTPKEVMCAPEVLECYLGAEED